MLSEEPVPSFIITVIQSSPEGQITKRLTSGSMKFTRTSPVTLHLVSQQEAPLEKVFPELLTMGCFTGKQLLLGPRDWPAARDVPSIQ